MKTARLTIEIDGVEHELPTRLEVCPRCEGTGTHTNPNIDGNGITSDEMAELGDDFLDDYLNGVYDVACERCGGRNVIPVVDEARCAAHLLAAYREIEQAETDYRALCRADARMEY